MKRIFTAAIGVAAIATLAAPPTGATTFPTLTTIYIASGVINHSPDDNDGVKTLVSCTNMSGQTASVRYIFRHINGAIGGITTRSLANLAALIVATEGKVGFLNQEVELATGPIAAGTLHILSTQSAVYCSAMLVESDAANAVPAGAALHMVRFSPHPGTVE